MACRMTRSKMNGLWRLHKQSGADSCRCQIRSFAAAASCHSLPCQPRERLRSTATSRPLVSRTRQESLISARSPCPSSIRGYSSAADPKPILQHAAEHEELVATKRNNLYHQYPLDVLNQLDMDPDALHALASQHPTPLSLADMYKYASVSKDQRIYNAQFLHKELAIRIAQRAVDLLTLPFGLSEAEPIRQVARLYLHYIKQLQEAPLPSTPEQEDKFTQLLQSFVLDRSTIPTQIARGVREWNQHTLSLQQQQKQHEHVQERQDVLEEALYRFFTARVGLRFLIEHHVISSTASGLDYRKLLTSVFPKMANNEPPSPNTTSNAEDPSLIAAGCIQSNVNVVQETKMVAELVKAQTLGTYGCCPEIHIVDCIQPQQQTATSRQSNPGFTYVPHHLHYMLAELLLNACRATVRHHRNADSSSAAAQVGSKPNGDSRKQDSTMPVLPPIRVVLVMGKEDITIKVCDKGGGIPRCKCNVVGVFRPCPTRHV